MARLIDADTLEYTRVRIYHGMNEDGTPCVGGENAVVMSCAIREAPTVEAVPVVHGRWLKTCIPDIYHCTNCKSATKMDELCDSEILRAYCPNCGAKMDGGD